MNNRESFLKIIDSELLPKNHIPNGKNEIGLTKETKNSLDVMSTLTQENLDWLKKKITIKKNI